MMNIPDINDLPVRYPQFDPEAPDTYPITHCPECEPINGKHDIDCPRGYADEQRLNALDDRNGVP